MKKYNLWEVKLYKSKLTQIFYILLLVRIKIKKFKVLYWITMR